MSIHDRVIESLKGNTAEIAKKRQQAQEIERKLEELKQHSAGTYKNQQQISDLAMKKAKLRQEMADISYKATKDAARLYDAEIERLKKLDMPKADEISADAELLKSGVRLTENELAGLMQKAENQNPTMFRLISQFADDNKIKLPVESRNYMSDNMIAAEDCKKHRSALNYVQRWLTEENADTMIDKMMGADT